MPRRPERAFCWYQPNPTHSRPFRDHFGVFRKVQMAIGCREILLQSFLPPPRQIQRQGSWCSFTTRPGDKSLDSQSRWQPPGDSESGGKLGTEVGWRGVGGAQSRGSGGAHLSVLPAGLLGRRLNVCDSSLSPSCTAGEE